MMNLLQILDFGSAKPDFATDFCLFSYKIEGVDVDATGSASLFVVTNDSVYQVRIFCYQFKRCVYTR
ncbi:hypothetical protein Hanom_Chr03g00267591 [Helianthus anomalus]